MMNVVLRGVARLGKAQDCGALLQSYGNWHGGLQPNVDSYNAVIESCAHAGMVTAMPGLIQHMQAQGMQPNRHTFDALLHGGVKAGDFNTVHNALDRLREARLQPKPSTLLSCWEAATARASTDLAARSCLPAIRQHMFDLGIEVPAEEIRADTAIVADMDDQSGSSKMQELRDKVLQGRQAAADIAAPPSVTVGMFEMMHDSSHVSPEAAVRDLQQAATSRQAAMAVQRHWSMSDQQATAANTSSQQVQQPHLRESQTATRQVAAGSSQQQQHGSTQAQAEPPLVGAQQQEGHEDVAVAEAAQAAVDHPSQQQQQQQQELAAMQQLQGQQLTDQEQLQGMQQAASAHDQQQASKEGSNSSKFGTTLSKLLKGWLH